MQTTAEEIAKIEMEIAELKKEIKDRKKVLAELIDKYSIEEYARLNGQKKIPDDFGEAED